MKGGKTEFESKSIMLMSTYFSNAHVSSADHCNHLDITVFDPCTSRWKRKGALLI